MAALRLMLVKVLKLNALLLAKQCPSWFRHNHAAAAVVVVVKPTFRIYAHTIGSFRGWSSLVSLNTHNGEKYAGCMLRVKL